MLFQRLRPYRKHAVIRVLALAWLVIMLGVGAGVSAYAQHANAFGVPSDPNDDQQPTMQPPPFQAPGGQTPFAPPPTQPTYPPPAVQRPPQQPFAGQPQPLQPAPASPPAGQAPSGQLPGVRMTVQQYFIGRWHGHTTDNEGQWDVDVSFRPDGVFVQVQTLMPNQFRIQLMGRYEPLLGAHGGAMNFELQQWQPRQVCNTYGCQPLNLPQHTMIGFQMLSRNTFRVQNGTFQRIGPPA